MAKCVDVERREEPESIIPSTKIRYTTKHECNEINTGSISVVVSYIPVQDNLNNLEHFCGTDNLVREKVYITFYEVIYELITWRYIFTQ